MPSRTSAGNSPSSFRCKSQPSAFRSPPSPNLVSLIHGSAQSDDPLTWLLSFSDMERGLGWDSGSKPETEWKLERTRKLLDILGGPDRSLTSVLIAGTKGKGSTAAFLASILAARGIRAGLYTQPHLQSYRERIRVDGVAIGSAELAHEVDILRKAVASLRSRHADAGEPTTFELTTALALHHFAVSGCAVAILEVGLGGRLDATNAVDPAVSVITPISRDHLAILGPTLTHVAKEKAGILRRGRPAFIAQQSAEPEWTLLAVAGVVGADATVVTPLGSDVRLALAGDHQRTNAALAVAAAGALPGASIDERAIAAVLQRVCWPGRFEIVSGSPTFVLDGAHNDASAEALARTLAAYAEGRPVTLVVGMHADKEAESVLRPLCGIASRAVATRSQSPRALPADDIATLCRQLGMATVVEVTVAGAIARARDLTDDAAVVAVAGSLAVVGEARDALGLPIVERLW